jgi:hypothetical protein
MGDTPARHSVLPAFPHACFRRVVFGLQEEVSFQIVARRQAMLLNVLLRNDWNEVELPELPELDVG